MLNTAGAVCFLGFLAAAAAVALAPPDPAWRRRAVSRFLLYAVLACLAPTVLQRDLWPFARWPMSAGLADAWAANTRVRAVDATGAGHDVDARAWTPLAFAELVPWLHRSFSRLDAQSQASVAAHLLDRAERARAAARAGRGVGRSVLGPLAAPGFNLHPRPWSDPRHVPAGPFVGVRIYDERWNQEERRRDPSRVRRTLVFEYRRP